MVTTSGGPPSQEVLGLFADLLAYPEGSLEGPLGACERLLAPAHPEAAAALAEFRAFAEGAPVCRLQEVYTGAFDFGTAGYPYVGYHLFGETYRRSVFLLGLKERYRADGFAPGVELPDHLAVLLRFLATTPDETLREELAREALLPALERMAGDARGAAEADAAPAATDAGPGPAPLEAVPDGAPRPYEPVLRALRLVLEARRP